MSDKKISTLLELLDEYKVEIPIVQRDYAQGRQDSHAESVRLNLLKDMKTAILGGVPLDLSFVYGKVEENKFIPIDGQQRLTTLFLLYLYAYREDKSKNSLLHNFTYETRITSREFLKKIIENRENIFSAEEKPSTEIKDSEWFVSSWTHDPTIKSALVMLDDIKKTFQDVPAFEERLTDEDNKPITFKFLEMQDLGMEDSLYIKLNARGKPLTEFENFKAQLIGRMKKLNLSYIDKFEYYFDCDWTDLFWHKYKNTFDQTYYCFFGILIMNYGVINDDKKWENKIDYNKIYANVFDAAFYTLNYLCRNSIDDELSSIVFSALSENRTYTNRVMFHAVTTYMVSAKGKDNGLMWDWLRVIKNMAYNSDLDNYSRYRNAIEGINALADSWNDIVMFFANKFKVTGFNQRQIEEEQIKAGIIKLDESFANKIYTAEQHLYFSGQIRSALYLAKRADGEYDEEIFDYYWTRISALFDATKPKYSDLLRQALLSVGDYTLKVSQFVTLCVDDPNEAARTPSLKSLFSSCGDITKQLLDSLDVKNNIKDQLAKIIQNKEIIGTDWRYCFIQYPELFTWMSVSHLRLRVLNGEMHIIQNKWANGYNYHLFLSALYLELEGRGIKSEFDGELGTSVTHCLYVKNYKIIFSNGRFSVIGEADDIFFKSQSEMPICEVADFIVSYDF